MVGSVGLALVVAIGGGIFIYRKSASEAAEQARIAAEAEKARQIAAAEAKAAQEEAERQIKEFQEQLASLQKQLADAKDPESQAAIRAQIQALDEARPTSGGRRSSAGAAPSPRPAVKPAPKPGKPCNCDPNDPMCDCL
jgi:alanyl-tRNA synthetase